MPTKVYPEVTIIWPSKWLEYWENIKHILVDVDGVICEYDFPKIVKEFFGVDLDSESIFAHDLADVLGVSPVEINAMFNEQVYGKPNFINGSLEILKSWEVKGYEIVIFSNRVKYMGKPRFIQWLIGNDIPFHNIDNLGTGEYNFHIDDSPGKLASTNSKVKLLYTQPWNKRCLDIQKQLIRVDSWEEIDYYIRGS